MLAIAAEECARQLHVAVVEFEACQYTPGSNDAGLPKVANIVPAAAPEILLSVLVTSAPG